MESRVLTPAAAGTLFVVSTPIGNMGDFSFRAVETLQQVVLVLAEDTRHSRHLLDRYEIRTPLRAYHEHNEASVTPDIVARLQAGDSVALISDAGTPLLSDPGARLVEAAATAGIGIVPVPGASALLAALVAAALPADRFTFYGFLARKGRERTEAIAELSILSHTAVLYEAPPRVGATLADLEAAGAGDRRAVVARELTKRFEEVRRGTVTDLARYYEDAPAKGEVVIVLEGRTSQPADEESVRARARALRAEGASARAIATTLTRELGVPRNTAYRLAHES